ncbi:NAD(P)H-dependent oxidoreductase [Fructilactobacillus fructivorans]|uniref:Flavodoxin family protein n=1 Tax=Fructilactobacillus fructivorans TaxID=1614 RepID=A0AAE6TVT2_9LACO|nr:NAD(P)H-dependent oxidoreductase [Fructilactobacillus fructivorans]KRK57222.1 NAD(P)H dehydrogenase (quinone) [Fructilactobacillus fructivorans]KRN40468.1 NAD(P)H dehydrogenase (quinone) [Fructilactobacillus fructivorans]KRN42810.1 NAD(P)H dehydrogenase (quinone) [Fructilactobacillus fructivorans]QFX92294.1 flavodoxin family protein [Fructilactobacillus fructivorans]RDV64846.1 flavodoxin family protein [Fructilactobacillus fructivorans]
MKTLIIVSHPEFQDSITQAFLKTSQAELNDVTWHCLDEIYGSDPIDVQAERELLNGADRIIFQFPLYWYSAPASLKIWEDDVLSRAYTYANEEGHLKDKEVGIVTSVGYPKSAFAAGASQSFSISQIMIPYEALAKQAGMKFMKPLVIAQFGYSTDEEKSQLLVDYQMYLTAKYPFSFNERETWMIHQLKKLASGSMKNHQQELDLIIQELETGQDDLNDLKEQINLIRNKEED